jgi:hypothetical protein
VRALFRFDDAVPRHPAVAAWMRAHPGERGDLARRWFAAMHACGDDVRELLHDGQPTACVEDAAFAYVDAFKAHVNVGFYQGAALADPNGLLQGAGRFMRHVSIVPGVAIDEAALATLIEVAYADAKARLRAHAR